MSQPILQASALRAIEARHAKVQPPLMERAGAAAVRVATTLLAGASAPPLVVAGPGNNGGDAFVVARLLKAAGLPLRVLFQGDPTKLPCDARHAYAAWIEAGGTCLKRFPESQPALIIDGIFGLGLGRPISGKYADWIGRINRSGVPILALDVPSGLDAETGLIHGVAVRATHTVTFIALKPGLLMNEGPDCCGELTVSHLDLDIPDHGKGCGQLISPSSFSQCLQPRPLNSHKGSFGSVAIMGGAPGMAGAALLAGRAALKLGAGRVYLGMLEPLAVDYGQPELMLRDSVAAIASGTVIAIGPGLGQSDVACDLLSQAIAAHLPLIVDADGLNLLATQPRLQQKLAVRPAPTLLTPHPAEAARLLGVSTEAIQADRITACQTLAKRLKAFVSLKGCGTVIASPGQHWFVNTSGNPGLASAGSGDVLTGMTAALLAQGWPSLEALLGAVYLHGAAADACVADQRGPIGLTAGEIIEPARRLFNQWVAG